MEKEALIEALETLKESDYSNYHVGYNTGVEDCIRVIADMYEPKFILTRLEYELLKRWNNMLYKFIARDKDGALYIYKEKPEKKNEVWGTLYGHKIVAKYFDDLFTFIEWKDEYPFSIGKLLINCEVAESD